MQAVILAAGRGTRMKELTANCPKPMLPLLGKPLLEWKLSLLPLSVDEVIFVVGYLGNCIREHFGNEWQGRKIQYVEQTELNGTGGAVMLVKNLVHGKFLVMMGDDLYARQDIERLATQDRAVLAQRVEKPQDIGLLETDEAGNLVSVVEHVTREVPGNINTGGYLLDATFFESALVSISEREFGLPQMLAQAGKKHPVKVIHATTWQPVGKPEDIPQAELFLRNAAGMPPLA